MDEYLLLNPITILWLSAEDTCVSIYVYWHTSVEKYQSTVEVIYEYKRSEVLDKLHDI